MTGKTKPNKIYIKPKEGLQVRDPQTYQPLPAAGAWVTRNSYWIKRQAEGSVEKATPPAKTKAPAKAPKSSAEE
jgi:hypothetical protein